IHCSPLHYPTITAFSLHDALPISGNRLGADYKCGSDCASIGGPFLMATEAAYYVETGLGLSVASSFPHRAERCDVQPGGVCNDGHGSDYECYAEHVCGYQRPDGWL